MSSYIPLLQTLVWPIFLFLAGILLREHVNAVLIAIRQRIERGDSVKVGPVELGGLRDLDYHPSQDMLAAPNSSRANSEVSMDHSWDEERTSIYRENKGIFIAHVLKPCEVDGQAYEIFIYLIKHQRNDEAGPHDLSEVQKAEFYLGHMWGHRIFEEHPKNGTVGMKTAAYAPFLCVCHVHLKDGTIVKLNKYIDFEMGERVFRRT